MAGGLRVIMAEKVVDLADYAGGASTLEAVPVLSLQQLREQSHDVKWTVKHAIPAESIGLMFGGSGTFKSFIAIDMALHVAHGLPWLGKKTRQGTVLIVAAEGGAGLWRRIVAWHRERRLKWDAAPVYVVPVGLDLGTDSSRVISAAEAMNIQPSLVIVDTLSQTFSGEENSAGEVSNYLRELSTWFRATWHAAVVVIHHTGHQATERPRGSSALRSNVDFMFGVFRDEKEMLATMECVKQKDGDLIDPVSFSLKVCQLRVDEDGDPITSLVATSLTDKGDVLDVMRHEAQRGRGGRNQLFLDLALNGIEEKKLRHTFYEAIDGDAEKKRQAYFRARKWAIENRLIEIAEGFVIRNGA
jgi:hypothetical protein